MEKRSKRVAISLTQADYLALSDYAEVMSSNPSAVIGDLLREVLPSMQSVTLAIKAVDSDKEKALISLSRELLRGVSHSSDLGASLLQEAANVSKT